MLKTVKQACKFNPIIDDYRMSQGIENLNDLIKDEGDGREFFERTYITGGMETLLRQGLLRLSGKSDQAVFHLNQNLGGGKTHLLVSLGLMARHPHLRSEFLPADLVAQLDLQDVAIAAFNGRNNPDNFVWGEIATQLGKAEAARSSWINGPKAIDQKGWQNLIGDRPTLILLDELPPYLQNAATQIVGKGSLADATVYSLSGLMSAALEMNNVCVVISNLTSSYAKQAHQITEAIETLQDEANRQAKTITPVSLSGNEIYEILRKRLLVRMPDADTMAVVAEAYAERIKGVADAGYIAATSMERVAELVMETYPFHPAFKHIVALFEKNESFRQTRGLLQFAARLLHSVNIRQTDDVFLVGAQHFDLNDPLVREEFGNIALTLRPAIVKDIADDGKANAETIDDQLGSDAASQVATLLLASSLSRAVGGRLGLTEGEIIEYLAAPNRKPDEFQLALEKMREVAWYLHREEQRFFIKETENLSRQIERNAKDIPQAKIDTALVNRLTAILAPKSKAAYQELAVMPKIDDIRLTGGRLLIVVRGDNTTPPRDINRLFTFSEQKNNFLVLSGTDSYLADAVELRLRELYATEQVKSRLKPGDTLYEEANDRYEDSLQRFLKAVAGAYNRLWYPAHDDLSGRSELMQVTIDQGLTIGDGEKSAEAQIERLLAGPSANYKLAKDYLEDPQNYWAQAELYLWPEKDRRMPWKDAVMRYKNNPIMPWLPGANGLENLKAEALKQGVWRQGDDAYLEKGPFPKEKTSVNVTVNSTNPETGEVVLTLTPTYAGSSPVIHYAPDATVSSASPVVEDPDSFVTAAPTLYFIAVDSEGEHETGEPKRWVADLKIRHKVHTVGTRRLLELQCTPPASLRYTLDGTSAKEGIEYQDKVELDKQAYRLLVYAQAGEANRAADFSIPAAGDKVVQIDDGKPARLNEEKRINLDTTDKVFKVINKIKDDQATRFKGVIIQLGEGTKTVQVRFNDQEVTAAMIEKTISALRETLNDNGSNVVVSVRNGAAFSTGFALKEFAEASGIELKPGDVQQET